MKTFTVRELDRQTAKVLDTCDRQGEVRIRHRDGRSYTLQRENKTNPAFSLQEWLAERRRKRTELFPVALTKKQTREFDRMIRGDRE